MKQGAGLLGAVGNFFGTAESPEKEEQEREPSEQLEEERLKESPKKAPSQRSDEQRSVSGVKVLSKSKGSNKSSQAKRQIDPEGEDKRNRDDYDKRL